MRRTCALGLSSLVLGATFSPRLSLPVVTRAASSPRFATTAEDVSVAAAAEVAPAATISAAAVSATTASEEPASKGRRECDALKETHKVRPGKSWGSLDEKQIKEWKARRCDQFYCKPSPMEAVGTYECIPL